MGFSKGMADSNTGEARGSCGCGKIRCMKMLIQRVDRASVRIDGQIAGEIDRGYLVLLGIHKEDTLEDAEWSVGKVFDLRLWPDSEGRMNLDLAEAKGSLLVISQFTLYASARKGRRPSYDQAMPPAQAEGLYESFVGLCRKRMGTLRYEGRVETGRFGAHMLVESVNNGPVTIPVESRESRRGILSE